MRWYHYFLHCNPQFVNMLVWCFRCLVTCSLVEVTMWHRKRIMELSPGSSIHLFFFGSFAYFFCLVVSMLSFHRLRRRSILLSTGDLSLAILTTLLSVILFIWPFYFHSLFSRPIYLCSPIRTSVLFRHSLFGVSTCFRESFSVFSSAPSPII